MAQEIRNARWLAKAESRAYDLQFKLVSEKYGAEAATNANYGWGVWESPAVMGLEINTKIYLKGHPVLTTIVNAEARTFEHRWSEEG